MKKILLFFLVLLFSCNSQNKEVYTFDSFKMEFQDAFDVFDIPIGTCFWEEFREFEAQYHLTNDEAKLLGEWINVTFLQGPINNYYSFFPNKLFVLHFTLGNTQDINLKNIEYNKALGVWEITNNIVNITIYSIITEDIEKKRPNNKDIFLVKTPYTINFININDIGEEGFTKRPINDTILSEELLQMVTILEPNKSNNLYVRNVYTIDLIPETKKNYGYFTYFPEMAQNNHTGFEIATNPELIRRYIPDWMF